MAALLLLVVLILIGEIPIFSAMAGKADTPGDFEQPPDRPAVDPVNALFVQSLDGKDVVDRLSVDLPFLSEFSGVNRQLLIRHLETSAAWFVGSDKGKLFAYQRTVKYGRRVNPGNGYIDGYLNVYTVTPTSISPAPGSPYTVNGWGRLIVVPKL